MQENANGCRHLPLEIADLCYFHQYQALFWPLSKQEGIIVRLWWYFRAHRLLEILAFTQNASRDARWRTPHRHTAQEKTTWQQEQVLFVNFNYNQYIFTETFGTHLSYKPALSENLTETEQFITGNGEQTRRADTGRFVPKLFRTYTIFRTHVVFGGFLFCFFVFFGNIMFTDCPNNINRSPLPLYTSSRNLGNCWNQLQPSCQKGNWTEKSGSEICVWLYMGDGGTCVCVCGGGVLFFFVNSWPCRERKRRII